MQHESASARTLILIQKASRSICRTVLAGETVSNAVALERLRGIMTEENFFFCKKIMLA